MHTIYFFTLLLIANIAGTTITYVNHDEFQLEKVWESVAGPVILSVLFWISCQWKPQTNIRIFLLPLFRTFFWTVVVTIGFWRNTRMESEDLLYAHNEFLFTWWGEIKTLTYSVRQFNEIAELFLVDIFGVAVAELLFIVAAVYLERLRSGVSRKANTAL